jgi:sporulation protein YlmC with PRC-barrel domain
LPGAIGQIQRPFKMTAVELVKVDVAVLAKGYRAFELIGSSIFHDKDEEIGSLDDIVIDQKKVLFAIIEVGGFLGLGGRLVAVPYDSLKIHDTGERIELPGASKEDLSNSPSLDTQTECAEGNTRACTFPLATA